MNHNSLSKIEQRAQRAEELNAFSGVKLSYIREQITTVVGLIGQNGIFDQYTKHDISHIDQLLVLAEWIIPEQTAQAMTPSDWLMLVLAIYFHDMGMLVTKKEFANRKRNSDFLKYKNEYIKGEDKDITSDDEDRFFYQEYVRANHAKRINNWINGNFSCLGVEDEDGIVCEIGKILEHFSPVFKRDLGIVCESHHLDDLDDFEKYDTCAHYGNDKSECVNLHYIAIILRTVDLLHITNDRTPSIQFRLISPTDSKSIVEWQKQQAVTAVVAKNPRDKDGKIDRTLPKDTIEVNAYFDKPDQAEAFFGLSAYIMFMRSEVQKCYNWIQLSIRQEGTENYLYPWQKVDDEKIETRGFEPHKLSFTVDQDSILKMLVGHTLYNNSSVVIRELIQNALDAVKLQYCIENNITNVASSISKGKVEVSWSSATHCLTICDNGTGMTIQEVESYLLTVGKSKYKSDEFKKKYPDFPSISRFGIGILTCFLIADDVDIATNSVDEETANIINLRKVNGKYLLKKVKKETLPELIRGHGTAITLHVRTDVNLDSLLADARQWVMFPPCQVLLDSGEGAVSIGFKSPKDALTQYLNEHQYTVDGKKYTVVEKEKDGITLAYALEYDAFLQEWSFFTSRWLSSDENDEFSPVGTCIEGIRVEFSAPGYKESDIIAVANTQNCSLLLTNVARSAIEDNQSTERYFSVLYELYVQHIQQQVQNLQNIGYSLSWAISESRYLITPLIQNGSLSVCRVRAHNINILQKQLAQIESIVLEYKEVRQSVSADDVHKFGEVLVVDSEMIIHAESLLRQVKSDTTLLSILKTVQEDIDIPIEIPLFCNYDSNNILHQYALQNKQATSISVNKQQRRIDIVFSTTKGRWDTFEMDEFFTVLRRQEKVHFPISDIEIDGITDELGIQTVNGLYLSYKNVLVQYVRELLQQFNYKESIKDMFMVKLLLGIITSDEILSIVSKERSLQKMETTMNKLLMSRSTVYSESLNNLWSKVNRNELMTKIIESKSTIYRLRDWSRGTERVDEYREL